MALLELTNVSKKFGGLVALDDISMSVEQGEIHALIGPNGAGKTTLLNVLTRLVEPTSGAMRFDATDLRTLRPQHLVRIGISRIFQHMELFTQLTVRENVLVGAHSLGHAGLIDSGLGWPGTRAEHRRLVALAGDALDYVGLAKLADQSAAILTGGQARLLGFARALVSKPKFLLLDELVAGLNSAETAHVADLVRQVRDQRGVTILVIEHDMRFIMGIADRITALNFGRKIAEGTPAEVQNHPDVIEAYLGQAQC